MYRSILQSSPNHAEACVGLGEAILRQEKNVDEAVSWFKRAKQINPNMEQLDYYFDLEDRYRDQSKRFRGSVKTSFRYDDNPGVKSDYDVFDRSNNRKDTLAGVLAAQLDYDLYRNSETLLKTGYALLGTSNSKTHEYDLLDNAIYLAASHKSQINTLPVTWGGGVDVDDLRLDDSSYLRRIVLTPTLT